MKEAQLFSGAFSQKSESKDPGAQVQLQNAMQHERWKWLERVNEDNFGVRSIWLWTLQFGTL